MSIFKTVITILNIILIMIFLFSNHPQDKNTSLGSLFIESVLASNIFLIWS